MKTHRSIRPHMGLNELVLKNRSGRAPAGFRAVTGLLVVSGTLAAALLSLPGGASAQETPQSVIVAQADARRTSSGDTLSTTDADSLDRPTANEHEDLLDALTISGQVRHRSEADYRSNPSPPVLHLLRSRLNGTFRPLADVTVFVQVQDARAFGSENPAAARGTLDGRAPALDLHQAYFAVTNVFGSPFGIKVGRQELAYGNQRLIGSVEWSNVGRSFDAGTLSFRTPRLRGDVFAARLVDDRSANSSQNLFGLYGTWMPGSVSVDLFGLLDNNTTEVESGPDRGKATLERYTSGVRICGELGVVSLDAEGAYQFGREAEGTAERAVIDTYLLSLEASVRMRPARLGALYTVLSGDDDPLDGRAETFNTLFATNHKFYGYLDLFPFYAAFRPGGLHDAALRAGLDVSSRASIALDLHRFSLAEPVDTGGRVLGQEADLTIRLRYNAHFAVVAGASGFLASETAETYLGRRFSSWLYLSTVVDF